MKLYYLFLLIILMMTTLRIESHSQERNDYQWILGGSSGGDGTLMNFNYSPVNVSFQGKDMRMEGSNTSMSDNEGNLLFYSNGCFIANADHELMYNGDDIAPGLLQDIWCPVGGSPLKQGVVSIPDPNNNNLYYIFNLDFAQAYEDIEFSALAPLNLYYQIIDMTLQNGLGEVIAKNQVAVQDTLARGTLSAVRHDNGEDWWIVIPQSHSNCYYMILVNSNGVQPALIECEGMVWNDSDSGQAVFSPDGTKYIRFNYQNGLNIFDFDASIGELNNSLVIHFPEDNFPTNSGAAISPNSRYLYVSARTKLYQFDLNADDIESSRILIAEWNGMENPSPTIFNSSALGPDGKIYITSSGSTLSLHVIHKPDCQGLNSEVEQNGISLPAFNFRSIPNFPHYRNESTDINCDSVIVSSNEISSEASTKFFPNPANNFVTIQTGQIQNYLVEFFDVFGQKRLTTSFLGKESEIDLYDLDQGVYFYRIFSEQTIIGKGKILIKKD